MLQLDILSTLFSYLIVCPHVSRPLSAHLFRIDAPLLKVEELIFANLGCGCLVLDNSRGIAHLRGTSAMKEQYWNEVSRGREQQGAD